MRIVNTAPGPRYITGLNKSLQPLEASREVPMIQLFNNKSFWRQVRSGLLTFKLSDADKALLGQILAEDAKPLPKINVPAVEHPAAYRRRILDAAAAKAAQARAKSQSQPAPPVNPACSGGTPDFGSVPGQPIPVVQPGQAVSLDQLKRHNQGVVVPRLSKGLV